MDVICVNDSYRADVLAFWVDHGVTYPKVDQVLTVRETVPCRGETGLRFEEIVNPQVPIKSILSGVIMLEPSFNAGRFRTLLGEKVEGAKEISKLVN